MPLYSKLKYAFIIFLGLFLFLSFHSKHQKAISSDIKLSAVRAEKTIVLKCETSEIYSNGGFVIDYKMKQRGSNFFIEFSNIRIPRKVNRNLEPARSIIELGNLTNGNYKLFFLTLKGYGLHKKSTYNNCILQKDSAQLLISDNNVQLIKLSQNAIE